MVKSPLVGAFLACLLLIPSSAKAAQTVMPLSTLEALIPDAPTVTIAKLDESSQAAALAAHDARRAGAFTASLAGGSYRELVTQTTAHNYVGAVPELGIRFPLGSSFEEQEALLEDSTALAQRRAAVQIARQEALRTLRTQYAAYWAAQRKAALTETFLSDENDVLAALQKRVNAHLSLPSEQLDIAADYASAHKNAAQFTFEAKRSLEEIGIVTGREFASFVADTPSIAEQGASVEAFADAAVAAAPAISVLEAQLERARDLSLSARRTPLEAGISFEQTAALQSPGGAGVGRSDTVGLDLRMPLEAKRMGYARRQQYEYLVERIQAQIALQTLEARANARNVFAAQREAAENMRYMQTLREAANEIVREQLLRRSLFSDATVEKIAQSRYAAYQASLSEIDARTELATRVAEAATLCADRCAATSVSAPPPVLSTYVWNSRPLLRADALKETFQDDLLGMHFGDFLLSFDASRLRSLADDPAYRASLRAFIEAAHAHHARTSLLLGDPHWLLPESRGELASIVRSLASYSFDELHLDIEPRQLSSSETSLPSLFSNLADTADAIARISPWPLALDVNYRDLSYLPLAHMKGRTITLMIYIANPEKVASIARPVLDAHPDIRFQIAQSVEPILSAEESYASKGRAAFLNAVTTLQKLLPEKNFAGIVIQSYDDYKRMAP